MSDLRIVGMGQAAPVQADLPVESPGSSPAPSIPSQVMGVPTTYLVLGVGTIGLIALVAALKKKRREPEIGYYGYPPQYGYPQHGYAPQGYDPYQQAMQPPPQPVAPVPQPPQQSVSQQSVPQQPSSQQSTQLVAKNRPRGRRAR